MAPMVETEPWASRAKMTGGGMNVLNGDLRLQPQAKNGLLDKKKARCRYGVVYGIGLNERFSAASYSPTQSPVQYHRR